MSRTRAPYLASLCATAIGGLLLTLGAVPAVGAEAPATTPTGSATTTAPTSHAVSIKPRPHSKASAVIPGAMTNHGGPVQGTPKVYVVFWGWTSDPQGVRPYLRSFLSGLGAHSSMSMVTQYGAGNPASILGGTWSDSAAAPASPTDVQVQAEARRAMGVFGLGSSVNTQVVVATPTGRSTAGFGSSFCAYHGRIAGSDTTYTNLPYMPDAGATCGLGSVNGAAGALDGVSIVEGHEYAETVTDPWLNAWYDAGGEEIGDKCSWSGLANVTTTTGTFAMQPEWSNAANNCVMTAAGATTIAGVADWDRDGKKDIIMRDNTTGLLFLYPAFAGVADYDRDGYQDVVARDPAGLLWHYPGAGTRGYNPYARVTIGNGWNGITFAGLADYDLDGKTDIIVRDDSSGLLWLYPGPGARAYSPYARVQIGNGWSGMTFAGVADYDRNGRPDIVAREGATGLLFVYPGAGARAYTPYARAQIGNGWGSITFGGLADYGNDSKMDIIGRVDSTRLLLLYPGPGTLAYSLYAPVQIGNGW